MIKQRFSIIGIIIVANSMCLATPGKIIEIKGEKAIVDFESFRKEINISLVKVFVGDWVVVHAGFAIEKVSPSDQDSSNKSPTL